MGGTRWHARNVTQIWDAVGMNILGPHQKLNEFEHQTHVASCPVSVFGAFHGENHGKFIGCQKNMKTCRHDGPADECVWKKLGVHRMSKKRERGTRLTSFISDQCRLHGRDEVARTKRHPNLGCSGHAHLRAPRKGRTNSDTKRTLRHARPVFSVRFTKKTIGNSYGARKI